jgi:hypothetical protein
LKLEASAETKLESHWSRKKENTCQDHKAGKKLLDKKEKRPTQLAHPEPEEQDQS